MTNLVSGSMLADKGLYFDTQHEHLNVSGVTIFYAPRRGKRYLLENNVISRESVSQGAFASTKSGTTSEWHQILAHAGNDSVQHLADAVKGVKVTNKDKVTKTNGCETCALSKGHRIVSRSPDIEETADEPFHRISYDLIGLQAGLNGDKWISHVACMATNFHMVESHKKKSGAVDAIRKAIILILPLGR